MTEKREESPLPTEEPSDNAEPALELPAARKPRRPRRARGRKDSRPDHPLIQARMEAIQARGGNPFLEMTMPEAVIKLKQGFGRLIRSKADRGIVTILDPRVLTKFYGQTFLGSLPACPRVVDDLRDLVAAPEKTATGPFTRRGTSV